MPFIGPPKSLLRFASNFYVITKGVAKVNFFSIVVRLVSMSLIIRTVSHSLRLTIVLTTSPNGPVAEATVMPKICKAGISREKDILTHPTSVLQQEVITSTDVEETKKVPSSKALKTLSPSKKA